MIEDREVIARDVVESMRRIIRAIDLHSRSLVTTYGLTGPQLMVLRKLAGDDPVGIGDLARSIFLSQATVTGIVDRLERRGLVTRSRSASDRRRVMVAATSDGRAVLAQAPPLLQEHFIAAFTTLPPTEQEQVLAALKRIVKLMEATDLEATPILATGPLDASSSSTQEFLDG